MSGIHFMITRTTKYLFLDSGLMSPVSDPASDPTSDFEEGVPKTLRVLPRDLPRVGTQENQYTKRSKRFNQ